MGDGSIYEEPGEEGEEGADVTPLKGSGPRPGPPRQAGPGFAVARFAAAEQRFVIVDMGSF